jgi:hypothetical protein
LDTIALHLLNPRPSIIHLGVRWVRRPPVIASPAQVAWAEPAGQDLRATVLLRQPEHKRFRILSVRTTSPLIQVSPPAKIPAARQQLQFTLSAKAKPGHYDEKVFLVLDTPGHPEFEVRVSAALR